MTLCSLFIYNHSDNLWATVPHASLPMPAATRVVNDTRNFDRVLTQILHDDLHWLDVADRVRYKLGVIMSGPVVARRLLYTGHQCCRQATSQVSHASTDGGATTPALHCWPPSIHGEGSDSLMTFVHSRTMCPSNGAWTLGCSLITSTAVFYQTRVYQVQPRNGQNSQKNVATTVATLPKLEFAHL